MKKFVSILLALAMMLAMLTSCGSSSGNDSTQDAESSTTAESPAASEEESAAPSEETADESPAASAGGAYQIGINNWVAGVYGLDALVYQASQVLEGVGDTCTIVNDGAELDKIISDLENMVNSGMDGVMWFGLLETNFSVGPQICEDAGVPFVFYDKLPHEQENVDAVLDMTYYAGGVGTDDYTCGYNMGVYAMDNGDSTFIMAGTEVGDPTSDYKLEGFEAAVTERGGTIVDTCHISSDAALTVSDMISAHPDVDAIYCTGDTGTLAAVSVLESTGLGFNIYGNDLGTGTVDYLRSGEITASTGGQYVEAAFAAVLLQNYLDGCPIRDENGQALMLYSIVAPIVPAEQVDIYEKIMISQYPLTADYLSDLFYANNPDVTAQDIVDAVEGFSFYDMVKYYYDLGEITDQDLEAAGLTYADLG